MGMSPPSCAKTSHESLQDGAAGGCVPFSARSPGQPRLRSARAASQTAPSRRQSPKRRSRRAPPPRGLAAGPARALSAAGAAASPRAGILRRARHTQTEPAVHGQFGCPWVCWGRTEPEAAARRCSVGSPAARRAWRAVRECRPDALGPGAEAAAGCDCYCCRTTWTARTRSRKARTGRALDGQLSLDAPRRRAATWEMPNRAKQGWAQRAPSINWRGRALASSRLSVAVVHDALQHGQDDECARH